MIYEANQNNTNYANIVPNTYILFRTLSTKQKLKNRATHLYNPEKVAAKSKSKNETKIKLDQN